MPSTTFLVQPSSMPITTTAATLGLRAGADQRAEVQLQVGAELQAAVGMRDGERALDVVRDGLGGGVGQVVHRQDDDVVAHADAAVLALVAPESRSSSRSMIHVAYQRLVLRLCTCACSPTRDRRDVLPMSTPYLITVSPGLQRLDARACGRSGCRSSALILSVLVLVHDPAGQLLAGLHALDHDDADGVALVVHHEMNHLVSCPAISEGHVGRSRWRTSNRSSI